MLDSVTIDRLAIELSGGLEFWNCMSSVDRDRVRIEVLRDYNRREDEAATITQTKEQGE